MAAAEWEVRLRTPKGMDDLSILVDPDTEEEARAVANFHIGRQGSPAYRLVYVRRHIVATSAERKAALPRQEPPIETFPEPGQPHAEDDARFDVRAAEKKMRQATSPKDQVPGRVGT